MAHHVVLWWLSLAPMLHAGKCTFWLDRPQISLRAHVCSALLYTAIFSVQFSSYNLSFQNHEFIYIMNVKFRSSLKCSKIFFLKSKNFKNSQLYDLFSFFKGNSLLDKCPSSFLKTENTHPRMEIGTIIRTLSRSVSLLCMNVCVYNSSVQLHAYADREHSVLGRRPSSSNVRRRMKVLLVFSQCVLFTWTLSSA